MANVLESTGWIARKFLIGSMLTLISLFVGALCVVAPSGASFGIVGVAGLILLWTIPDLRTVPVNFARKFFRPALVASLSIPFYLAIVVPGAPLLSIRRLIVYAFVGATIIVISASSKHRSLLYSRLKQFPILWYCIASYAAIIIITVPISVNPVNSLNGIVQAIIVWAIPFIATIIFVESKRDIYTIFCVLLGCMLFDFIIGAIEFKVHYPILWRLLPAATRSYIISAYPLYAGMETGGFRNGEYRALSTYTVGISWAEYVGIVSGVAAYFLMESKSFGGKLLGAVSFVAVVLSLIFAGSRGGYASTLASVSVYLILWAVRKARIHPESLAGVISTVLAVMTVTTATLAVLFVPKFHIMIFGNGATQASNEGRALEWAAAWPKIYRSPIWGHGFGTAGDVVNFMTAYGQGSLDDGRINLLVETGIIGFSAFYGILIVSMVGSAWIYINRKSDVAQFGAAIASAMMAYMIFRTGLSQVDNNIVVYLLVGIVFAIYRITPKNQQSRGNGDVNDQIRGAPSVLQARHSAGYHLK